MNGKAFRIGLALVILCGGCVGTRLQSTLDDLKGKNVRMVTDKLGYPKGQREFQGDIVYSWSIDQPSAVAGLRYICTLDIGTDPDGTIKHYNYQGNNAGCDLYRSKLAQ